MTLDIEGTIQFHGHFCPGLAIGIRVSEMALRELGERAPDEELVGIAETRSCSVDAVQYLTGCTLGKGNLVLEDKGKNAFRFYRRKDGKAVRIRQRIDAFPAPEEEEARIMLAWRAGTASASEEAQAQQYRQLRLERIMSMPLDELLEVSPIAIDLPPYARIFDSVACAGCGEKTQENLLTLFEGEAYCRDCFARRL